MATWSSIPLLSLCAAAVVGLGADPAHAQMQRPDPTFSVDLARYGGTWFQIWDSVNENDREFEQREEINGRCVGTTVTYDPQADGTVRLLNECFEGGFDGRRVTIQGTARPVNANRTELKVRFDPLYLRIFEFDYWILWVDPDYRIALLGSPTSQGYTILSRTADPDQALLKTAEEIAARKGYDRRRTVDTPQRSMISVR